MPGPFDRIFADVRKDIPSVTDAVLRQELFRVLDDFTQFTNVFQQELPLAIQANVSTYDLNPLITEGEGKINRLLLVYNPSSETMNWAAGGITMRVPGIIQLYRPQTSDASWKAIVAKRTAEPLSSDKYPNIDGWIVDKNADTLGRGIIARLMWEPGKPYSNPMLAAANQRAYISGRSLARVNNEHANIFDAQNWKYPQGWSTVQRKPYA